MTKVDTAETQLFSIRARILFATVFLGALILVGGGWAAQAKLSGAVIAHGQVAVKSQLKVVQHPDGGVIHEIRVDNGDRVQAGDVVLRLDDTQLKSELGIVETQIRELAGRKARLIAVRDSTEDIVFPAGFGTSPETAAIAEGERRLLLHDRSMQALRRDQLLSQIDQFDDEIRALEAQSHSNGIERKLRGEDHTRLSKLLKKGLTEQGAITEVERDMARLDGVAGEIEANIARVKGQISESNLRILELDHQARTAAQKELRDIDAQLAELHERAVAARDRLSRTEIRAPIAGVINELGVHTVNGVIAPGERVMAIVPDGELMVEARLPITDIDQVMPGQAVRLRFSAFNQRTTPEVAGMVRVVAASATKDESGASYYLCTVAMTEAAQLPDGRKLMPGMPVEVFFQTGERTAISYLLKPVADQVHRSMRED
ncbi:secretion protein HlyD [Thioclava sp. L04-15]|uniref:HlyD family type I secretion periplasmic adaptor subunit n=1 Tax=Thioclava sp. L04-15 TaxID=1915318 RepID=UPI0009985979|nr:HlyD family type I secretion periplasmic adaptor subunit [Thioclava sp. L04-15]OOY27051.1 secretion protein HlyD [Thioclava sp. L04-15]TNE84462.1 MAG: HlyD family type I secretion periplasmic adaptor subunit [Paracoccaceae bacterium]